MPGDYGYANARLRAMGSRLLGPADYAALLERVDTRALIAALSATEYKDELEVALLHTDGVGCIFEALRLNVERTFRSVRTFFEPDEPQRLVELLLSRWDLFNLRTILRGQVARIPSAEILESLIPAGQLDRVALETLARQTGLQATVDTILTQRLPYARPLARAMRTYRGREDLAALELALDRIHYTELLASLESGSAHTEMVRQILQTEIDVTNLSTFFRLRRPTSERTERDSDHGAWLIPGGVIHDRHWQQLAAAITSDDIVASLAGTPYQRIVAAGLDDNGRDLHRTLERYLTRQGMEMWRGDPLSIAIAIGYVWAKISEVVNLRLVAYAVAGELAHEMAREELILWRNSS